MMTRSMEDKSRDYKCGTGSQPVLGRANGRPSGGGRVENPSHIKLLAVPSLVILVGLPASGKSTYYFQHLAATHVHVSKDLLARGARQEPLIEKALAAGQSVVVDNTNPSPAIRAP